MNVVHGFSILLCRFSVSLLLFHIAHKHVHKECVETFVKIVLCGAATPAAAAAVSLLLHRIQCYLEPACHLRLVILQLRYVLIAPALIPKPNTLTLAPCSAFCTAAAEA